MHVIIFIFTTVTINHFHSGLKRVFSTSPSNHGLQQLLWAAFTGYSTVYFLDFYAHFLKISVSIYASATGRCGGGIMFSGCPSVTACVCPRVRPVSTITSERVERFWPNLTQIFYTTVRQTIFEGRESRSRSLQSLIFERVIAVGGGIIIIDTWASKYHLVSSSIFFDRLSW